MSSAPALERSGYDSDQKISTENATQLELEIVVTVLLEKVSDVWNNVVYPLIGSITPRSPDDKSRSFVMDNITSQSIYNSGGAENRDSAVVRNGGGGKTNSILKPSPRLETRLLDNLLKVPIGGIAKSDGPENGSPKSMKDEAWEQLTIALVKYEGQHVGTIAAIESMDKKEGGETLNYNQVFVRDLFPSALACLTKTDPDVDIVKNVLLKTLHLQGSEKRIDNFTLGEGVMPASFKVNQEGNDGGNLVEEMGVKLEEDGKIVGEDDRECDMCTIDYDDDDDKKFKFDRKSFSKLLRKVPLGEARLYAQMSYLGSLAYSIPQIKPGNLLRYHGLRFVTSSVEKKEQALKIEKEKLSSEEGQKEVKTESETEDAKGNEITEKSEIDEKKNNENRISASAAYQIAASAASYLHSHTKSILHFKSSKSNPNENSPEGSNGNIDIMNKDVASLMATTDSVTAVVAAKEEVKQAVADDLNSTLSSPCEWFICDDDQSAMRFFVIQGSESLASWQANLLFEPIQFEGLDVLVHRGIYEAAKGIYEQMLPEIHAHLKSHGDRATLRFTGHSLGGSLSVLVNLMLLIRGEVPRSSLLPVITFGAPSIMCGGDRLLRNLGLPRNHIQSITMHRDIVPRAFSCNYPNHVAEFLKAINENFRNLPCLNKQKLLYTPMGEFIILQPDNKFSPSHDLLPSGSGLYILSCSESDISEAEKQIQGGRVAQDSELPEEQRGMKLILNLCLSDGFDAFPTLLRADGCSMTDRRMGIYGCPIEIQERWEDLIGEMPLKIVYPALEGHEWAIVTRCDPTNSRWSYYNGGSWPVPGDYTIAAHVSSQIQMYEDCYARRKHIGGGDAENNDVVDSCQIIKEAEVETPTDAVDQGNIIDLEPLDIADPSDDDDDDDDPLEAGGENGDEPEDDNDEDEGDGERGEEEIELVEGGGHPKYKKYVFQYPDPQFNDYENHPMAWPGEYWQDYTVSWREEDYRKQHLEYIKYESDPRRRYLYGGVQYTCYEDLGDMDVIERHRERLEYGENMNKIACPPYWSDRIIIDETGEPDFGWKVDSEVPWYIQQRNRLNIERDRQREAEREAEMERRERERERRLEIEDERRRRAPLEVDLMDLLDLPPQQPTPRVVRYPPRRGAGRPRPQPPPPTQPPQPPPPTQPPPNWERGECSSSATPSSATPPANHYDPNDPNDKGKGKAED